MEPVFTGKVNTRNEIYRNGHFYQAYRKKYCNAYDDRQCVRNDERKPWTVSLRRARDE